MIHCEERMGIEVELRTSNDGIYPLGPGDE